jgi:hypothetical protein
MEGSDDLNSLKYLWFDYQLNTLAWPIFSERMRELIDSHATGAEGIDWISVLIHQGQTEIRPYYLLRFNEKKDVLKLEESTFVDKQPTLIIKPVFAQDKISNLSVFTEFVADENWWQITPSICVSEIIRQQAKKAKFVGLHYEDARVN